MGGGRTTSSQVPKAVRNFLGEQLIIILQRAALLSSVLGTHLGMINWWLRVRSFFRTGARRHPRS